MSSNYSREIILADNTYTGCYFKIWHRENNVISTHSPIYVIKYNRTKTITDIDST